jgi:hypothetical protein
MADALSLSTPPPFRTLAPTVMLTPPALPLSAPASRWNGCLHCQVCTCAPLPTALTLPHPYHPLPIKAPENSEMSQLSKIFEVLGTCTDVEWPGLSSLPLYHEPTPSEGVPFKSKGGQRGIFGSRQDDEITFLEVQYFYWLISCVVLDDAIGSHACWVEASLCVI